jgi:hypothetical protein
MAGILYNYANVNELTIYPCAAPSYALETQMLCRRAQQAPANAVWWEED